MDDNNKPTAEQWTRVDHARTAMQAALNSGSITHLDEAKAAQELADALALIWSADK